MQPRVTGLCPSWLIKRHYLFWDAKNQILFQTELNQANLLSMTLAEKIKPSRLSCVVVSYYNAHWEIPCIF